MTEPLQIRFTEMQLEDLKETEGRLVVFADADGKLSPGARKVNGMTRKALDRVVGSEAWGKLEDGELMQVSWPSGIAAESVLVVRLARNADALTCRKAGASVAKARGKGNLTILAGAQVRAAEVAFGLALRAYQFVEHKSIEADPAPNVEMRVNKPEEVAAEAAPLAAVTEGVFFARDLTNAPANVLTTLDFAARLGAMQELGLEVEILEEQELEALGMRLLLAVGEGSESPSRVVVMRWNGGGDEAPLGLLGKGVVFDSGGISIKPAAGMEEMVMDMGGAGIVSGVMRTLALRRAKANVIGIVGLVENMPSGKAARPGDIVTSMKGDTVEVVNTDAEGRLVLADLLWYAQEKLGVGRILDFATLTGAMVVALGHEHAGVFSNDDELSAEILSAAMTEGEGAWRMPMGPAYDKLLKSSNADMKNIGGRWGGAITAAQFLKRFVKDGTAWAHLDVAGVAMPAGETDFAPKGASGWGVMAINRMIAETE